MQVTIKSKRESIFVKYVQDTHTHTYTHIHMHTTYVLYTHILAHIAIQVHSQARRKKKKKRCCSKDMKKRKGKINYIFKYTRDTNTKTRYTHVRKRRDFDKNHATENARRIHSQK